MNSFTCVRKPNTLRICLDPNRLNQAIKTPKYPIPTFDDILAKVNGAKYFTVLDLKKGFLQLELDEESSDLCAFNTPFGRYKFKNLAFGIKSAPEVFQQIMDEVFGDIEGVSVYIDDLLIPGKTKEDHDIRLKKVLQRARENNVVFNHEKIQLRQQKIKYLGHVFTDQGLKPDESKVEAIVGFPEPNDKDRLKSLLGLIQYESKFIPKLSTLTADM
ncbi:Transposon Ty3-I Gag-Pol polyprotein-like protein, partial [Leptotrombidium deliense]